MSDEGWMAKNIPQSVLQGQPAVVEKEAWNKSAIVIVNLITMILKRFLTGMGDLCSQGIEIKSCNLWKGMSPDKANLSGFQG